MRPVSVESENLSRSLDMTPEQWRLAMQMLANFGSNFLAKLEDIPASHPSKDIVGGRQTPADEPEPLQRVIEDFSALALESGIESSSGRFFGYIPGGGMPSAAIGDAIAALTNRYTGVQAVAPGAVDIENQVIRWIRNLLEWPDTSWGTLQSGGSMATLTAIIAARSTRAPELWSRSVIYASAEAHHCFQKAAMIAGLEAATFRRIPIDRRGRMSIEALASQIEADKIAGLSPWILCATAGSTNLGAIDPLHESATLCAKEKMWMHVDAAYGGFFWLCDEGKRRLEGMQLGDSIVLDPHKGLFQPYGIGIVLVKNAALLRKSLASHASYLRDTSSEEISTSPSDYSPELTRHFRALRLWVSLKHHGLAAFRAAILEKLDLCRYAFLELQKVPDICLFAEPSLSILAFRCIGHQAESANAQTEALKHRILQRGRIHLSSTEIDGFTYLRLCVLSFRSHLSDVDTALKEIKSALHP